MGANWEKHKKTEPGPDSTRPLPSSQVAEVGFSGSKAWAPSMAINANLPWRNVGQSLIRSWFPWEKKEVDSLRQREKRESSSIRLCLLSQIPAGDSIFKEQEEEEQWE